MFSGQDNTPAGRARRLGSGPRLRRSFHISWMDEHPASGRGMSCRHAGGSVRSGNPPMARSPITPQSPNRQCVTYYPRPAAPVRQGLPERFLIPDCHNAESHATNNPSRSASAGGAGPRVLRRHRYRSGAAAPDLSGDDRPRAGQRWSSTVTGRLCAVCARKISRSSTASGRRTSSRSRSTRPSAPPRQPSGASTWRTTAR